MRRLQPARLLLGCLGVHAAGAVGFLLVLACLRASLKLVTTSSTWMFCAASKQSKVLPAAMHSSIDAFVGNSILAMAVRKSFNAALVLTLAFLGEVTGIVVGMEDSFC